MRSLVPVGIDAMAWAIPRGFVELSKLADARQVPREKYRLGLGVEQMAVAAFEEDTVALATNAARRLFRLSGRSLAEVGLCVVGTETAVDHAKPIAVYVHRLLGLPSTCRVFETKHACYGGTAGLLSALDWLVSGSARGRTALVLCSDIARYPLHSLAEPTQGAGAVALLLSTQPRLLSLEPGISGIYTKEVSDFWRPLHHHEARTNGLFSIQCYLEALTGAYRAWQSINDSPAALTRTCYHVPYGKMARKAHQHFLSLDKNDVLPTESTDTQASSLLFPSRVGNLYTGSLYVSLLSLLQQEARELEGQRIGLFSYGSGCIGEFFAGTVQRQAALMAEQLQWSEPLQSRQELSISAYEAIRNTDETFDEKLALAEIPLLPEPTLSQDVHFMGIDSQERRIYQNVPIKITPARSKRYTPNGMRPIR